MTRGPPPAARMRRSGAPPVAAAPPSTLARGASPLPSASHTAQVNSSGEIGASTTTCTSTSRPPLASSANRSRSPCGQR